MRCARQAPAVLVQGPDRRGKERPARRRKSPYARKKRGRHAPARLWRLACVLNRWPVCSEENGPGCVSVGFLGVGISIEAPGRAAGGSTSLDLIPQPRRGEDSRSASKPSAIHSRFTAVDSREGAVGAERGGESPAGAKSRPKSRHCTRTARLSISTLCSGGKFAGGRSKCACDKGGISE